MLHGPSYTEFPQRREAEAGSWLLGELVQVEWTGKVSVVRDESVRVCFTPGELCI